MLFFILILKAPDLLMYIGIFWLNAQGEFYTQPLSETVGLMQETILKSRETIIMFFNSFLAEETLTNSGDTDETLQNIAYHLGRYCLLG